jgi:hypothetical protein
MPAARRNWRRLTLYGGEEHSMNAKLQTMVVAASFLVAARADGAIPALIARTFESTANNSGIGGGASYGVPYVGDNWTAVNDMRGIIEFPLAGATATPAAILSLGEYNVQYGSNFAIAADVYQANGVQDYFTDYQSPPATQTIALFWRDDHVGLNVPICFDITGAFNAALAAGWTAFGVRLRQVDESGTVPRAVYFEFISIDDGIGTVPDACDACPLDLEKDADGDGICGPG